MATAREDKVAGQTPLMRQYYKIKARYPNAILLFRMGDFYETFEEDAQIVSRVLGITLTKRANGQAADVPLAGFPYHALDNYLPKLVRAGYRVAICEQLEDPKLARKVVKRDVVEVVTPGVSLHEHLLDPKRSNYLAAVVWGTERHERDQVGFAFLDASTGEFSVTEVPVQRLEELLQTISPAEVLVDKRQRERLQGVKGVAFVLTPLEDWVFSFEYAYEVLLRHFKTHSLKGFGVDDLRLGLRAAGAALHYLNETQQGRLPHVRRLTRYASEEFMVLDPQTKRNLELVASLQDGRQEGSLVQILDETLTPMGGRLLRRWLLRPLKNVRQIEKRLDAVEALVRDRRLRERLREELRQVGDLERLAARVCTGRATPRDLMHLRLTLEQIPPIKQALADVACDTLRRLAEQLTLCAQVTERIRQALVDDPPATLSEGGVIRDGFCPELDELREIARSGKDFVARLQQKEIERTGIPSLKVGFNKVFGYYIEVTNTHRHKIPAHYIRKQTLVNAERYITPELKEYEEKILSAEEKIVSLEGELFNRLRLEVAEATAELQLNASLLAMLDVFCSLAEVADRYGYRRPELHEGTELLIEEGRHPVVERTLPPGEPFIPNDIYLDTTSQQILIITGPNMAGKSVVLRQTGLIVLLAQIGSFVPARRARIGIVDRIFTRVGASDNLAAGESTFLVEMNETANILNNATPRSLILLDEVGRGTSTFDGLSIAWALVEYLHETPSVAARTLFATHYHELNELAERLPRVKNYRVQVEEHEGKVIFLHKLVPGGADHSYGIEVARMAGLPEPVVLRAREILQHLEAQHLMVEAPVGDEQSVRAVPVPRRTRIPAEPGIWQLSLFATTPPDPVTEALKERLRRIDPNRLTPIEALLLVDELKRLVMQHDS
ncbi:DNA mismatch repair protein MutS [Rhodothermus bifroesti]|uniref:DNA mismatch repair protein MutS n=1 Tax=Rhodothermus marinus TaxID=29549 RepID=A0A7V2F668_RHOMR|nr:DNA mismatch repair protein MutS [Rhodothermus bifroesti]GBD00653.1 DNA mismatch repair protein MutS [bacterium HR18]